MKKLLLLIFVTTFLNAASYAQPTNDECINAIPITVNLDPNCSSITSGTITGATASNVPIGSCIGSPNDDVWFVFTPINTKHIITLSNLVGSTQNINFALYSGSCGTLVPINCSLANSLQMTWPTFIIGSTYFIRVWSNPTVSQNITFTICVNSFSTCENSQNYCGSANNDPFIFANTTGNPNQSQVACLGSIPNSTFFTLKVTEPGTLKYNIIQNSNFDVAGNPIGQNFDADFVAWGPFPDNQSCNQISLTGCTCPNNTTNTSFYPFGNIVDCSYSGSAIENLTITNALVGQYYKILISNFSNQPGFIKLQQTNFADPIAGKTVCADRIQLSAFLDLNSNEVKDSNESNFNLGTFKYQVNNVGDFTYISSPFGKHSIYDSNPINSYDVSFEVFPEYANFYSLTSPTYNDLIIGLNSGNQIINFPVTKLY